MEQYGREMTLAAVDVGLVACHENQKDKCLSASVAQTLLVSASEYFM
jgi:hypothetical protein